MVKNIIFRKGRSGQLMLYSPLEVSEAETKNFPSIHCLHLPQNGNFVKPDDISKTRKIDQTLKIHKAGRKM